MPIFFIFLKCLKNYHIMKQLYKIILMGLILGWSTLQAQTTDNPWLITAGLGSIHLQESFISNDGVLYQGDDLSFSKNPNIGVPSLGIFRKIVGGLSLGGQFAYNNINQANGNETLEYLAAAGMLKYGFGIDKGFSPYLKAGYGMTSKNGLDADFDLSRSLSRTYLGSLGFNVKLGDRFGAFLETNYKTSGERNFGNHFNHVVGFSYGLGSRDADKDGIIDEKDKCPEVPGLKEFDGCPDTDGDGLPDNEDECPEEAGTKEMKGCPDQDGDTVADKDDECPEEAGLVELNGCPDADEDGVADKDDECPEEAGNAENNGCPWPDADNDGVLDKDDACPNEAGDGADGCPSIAPETLEALNKLGVDIQFAADSDKIMGKKVMGIIDEVKQILLDQPEISLIIEGHASTDGGEEYNMDLSTRRANAVRDYLISNGVDGDRLEAVGYGETRPKAEGDSPEARAKNRRVEFSPKQ